MDAGSNINSINSLILLFVFDKMDIPLTENTILDMCTSRNVWINYMDCKQAFLQIIDKKWLAPVEGSGANSVGEVHYTMTVDGRMCLAHLYYNIPSSLRALIVDYVNANRMHFRRKQEYYSDYYLNSDGSFTVILRITDPARPLIEICLNVDTSASAKSIHDKWQDKAPQVYAAFHELMLD